MAPAAFPRRAGNFSLWSPTVKQIRTSSVERTLYALPPRHSNPPKSLMTIFGEYEACFPVGLCQVLQWDLNV